MWSGCLLRAGWRGITGILSASAMRRAGIIRIYLCVAGRGWLGRSSGRSFRVLDRPPGFALAGQPRRLSLRGLIGLLETMPLMGATLVSARKDGRGWGWLRRGR